MNQRQFTLEQLLRTQDMGQKGIDIILDKILNNTFDANADPISAIIINVHEKYWENDFNLDNFQSDLDYAINQLTKVRNSDLVNKL